MTDPDQPEMDERPAFVRFVGRFSPRERAIFSGTTTLSLVAGFWIGLNSVPDAALDVPKTEVAVRHGTEFNAAFTPIPNWAIILSVFALFIGGCATYRSLQLSREEGSA